MLTNAAGGCGSGLKEYGLLFAGRPEEEAARSLAAKVRDVSTFLATLESEVPPPLPGPLRVAYHDACHLAHAQSERAAPRRLLARVPNLTLVEPRDWQSLLRFGGDLQPGGTRTSRPGWDDARRRRCWRASRT